MEAILFIPWTLHEEGDVHQFQGKWAAASGIGDRAPLGITYKAGTPTLANHLLLTKIYVGGHGGAGHHSIYSRGNVKDAVALTYQQVADRLVESGLHRKWRGEIVLQNCDSAAPGPRTQSFAAKFAQYMRAHHKMYLARYAGYLGAVSSYPTATGMRIDGVNREPSTTPSKAHKWVALPGSSAIVKSKFAKVYF